MLIDCDSCVVRGDACSECVIGVLLRRPPTGTPVDLDADEAAAIGALAGVGMVPPLRLVPVASVTSFVPDSGADTPDPPRGLHSRPSRGRVASWPPRSGRSAGIA